MPFEQTITEVQNFPAQSLFDLVLDVNSYSSFLPYCTSSKIISHMQNEILADVTISFSIFRYSYRSIIKYDTEKLFVEVTHDKTAHTPFVNLINTWEFTRITNNSAQINFFVSFEFTNKIVNLLVSKVFNKISKIILETFQNEAKKRINAKI